VRVDVCLKLVERGVAQAVAAPVLAETLVPIEFGEDGVALGT